MILSLLLIVLCVALTAGAVLLFSPFSAKLTFETAGLAAAGGGVFSFLHPALVSVTFNIAERSYILKLLGRQWGKKKDMPEAAAPQPAPVLPEVTVEAQCPPESSEGDRTAEPVSIDEAVRPGNGTPDLLQLQEQPPVEASVISEATVAVPATETPAMEHTTPLVTDVPPVKATVTDTEYEEKVAPKPQKRDNWFRRLERNRYLFFVRNSRWRANMFRWLFSVVRTFFRIVKFDHFNVAVRAGVSDPVITGTLSGLYQAAFYGLPMHHPPAFSFEPVFMRNHFACKGSIRVTTSLAQLLLPVVVAVATFPVLHTLWLVWLVYRRERRYKKEAAV